MLVVLILNAACLLVAGASVLAIVRRNPSHGGAISFAAVLAAWTSPGNVPEAGRAPGRKELE
jgi:hypothetical protein